MVKKQLEEAECDLCGTSGEDEGVFTLLISKSGFLQTKGKTIEIDAEACVGQIYLCRDCLKMIDGLLGRLSKSRTISRREVKPRSRQAADDVKTRRQK